MFEVKKLVRKNPVNFSVRPMVKRFSSPVQERAATIKSMLDSGVSYQNAVREYDRQQKAKRK
jgi:hypothetical protein